MYQPKAHEETDLQVMQDLIQAFPFGCVVTTNEHGLSANHIPFLIDTHRGNHGTLRGHIARANPLSTMIAATTEAPIIFQGPDAYISPTWYPSKHETGKAVPTWNYVAVHAHGLITIKDDPVWVRQMVSDLTDLQEGTQKLPWKLSDAPEEYIDKMMTAIVGIEIPITRLEGKWKVSQNRTEADRLGVAAGLQSRNTESTRAIAELVLKSMQG